MVFYKVLFFYCVIRWCNCDIFIVFFVFVRFQVFCRFSYICGELLIIMESLIVIFGVKVVFFVSNWFVVEGVIFIVLVNLCRLILSLFSDF